VLDIDRPDAAEDDPEAQIAADEARDRTLAEVWRAFSFDEQKQPVILMTPGGGYHVYMPLCRARDQQERTWPLSWSRRWIEHHLEEHGVKLMPGRLELYPSGVPLRAPCGRRMALLVPSRPESAGALDLQVVYAGWRQQSMRGGMNRKVFVRDISATVEAFLERIERSRRPIEDWIETKLPAWDTRKWGPWGNYGHPQHPRPPVGSMYQHKEEVPVSVSGPLLYGVAFRRRVVALLLRGLCAPGVRHDAVLKLVWYWGIVLRCSRQRVLADLEVWLKRHAHKSGTLSKRGRDGFVRDTMREAVHYWDTRVIPCLAAYGARGKSARLKAPVLSLADWQMLDSIVESRIREVAGAILMYLRTYSDSFGKVRHAVSLGNDLLEMICGQGRLVDRAGCRRRAYVVAMEELERAGVLTLATDYSVNHHGRRYLVLYRFGSGRVRRRLGIRAPEGRVELHEMSTPLGVDDQPIGGVGVDEPPD
jgi:hypothetical protein